MGSRYRDLSIDTYLSHYQSERPINWAARFRASKPLDVELGFGLGDYLIRLASQNPDRHVVGIEQEWERVKKTLRKVGFVKRRNKDQLNNLRILQVDAVVALERLFRPLTIDRLICLFPCPWPKKQHIKHRLFSHGFLRLVNNRLAVRGGVSLVTDSQEYLQWVNAQLPDTGFANRAHVIQPQYNTKYERKWLAGGQQSFFQLDLTKQEHVDYPLEEDAELRVYFVNDFDADNFRFQDVKGDTSIILKRFIFDSKQQKGMLHLVVAEKSITQHVWVALDKTSRGWRIAKAEGQTLLPTKGVARALSHVYHQVKNSCLLAREAAIHE